MRPPSTAVGIAAERVDADGFLDTGDLARVDADGFVWIEGRAGDVINRGGNKVFPEHVEEVLRFVPGVAEAAVVGVPDDRLGEVPVAYVVTTAASGDDLDEDLVAQLVAICREHLAPYKVPVAFRRVDALPRSEVGKVLRRELAGLTAEDSAGSRTRLGGKIARGARGRVGHLGVGVGDAIADPREAVRRRASRSPSRS